MPKVYVSRGSLKGSRIDFCESPGLRPTTSKIRAAVFSMLMPRADSHGFIDVFSGTGVMAFEAHSCGFQPVIITEANPKSRKMIVGNAERLGIHFEGVYGHAFELLSGLHLHGDQPWIFYLDPPFSQPELRDQFIQRLVKSNGLNRESFLVIESPKSDQYHLPGLNVVTQKCYGSIKVQIAHFSSES